MRYINQERQAVDEHQDYINTDESESDFSCFGGANCLVSRDRVHGSMGALCGGWGVGGFDCLSSFSRSMNLFKNMKNN